MKIHLSFKTPDVVDYALEASGIPDDDAKDTRGTIKRKLEKWIEYGECLTMEFDTETGKFTPVEVYVRPGPLTQREGMTMARLMSQNASGTDGEDYRSRKWLIHDLGVLLREIRDRGVLTEEALTSDVSDMDDADLDALVTKVATIHEAIGLA